MESTSAHDPWISLYLFTNAQIYGALGDSPLVASAGRWSAELKAHHLTDLVFAIRYLENGPHVRWRARATEGQRERLRARMLEHAEPWANAERGRRIAEVAYEPEVDRYGGPYAISHSERMFAHSTDLAVRWAASGRLANPEARLGLAFATMLAALHTLSPKRDAITGNAAFYKNAFLRRLPEENGHRQQVEDRFDHSASAQQSRLRSLAVDLLACFDSGEEIDRDLTAYLHGLVEFRQQLDALSNAGVLHGPALVGAEARIASIFFSHIHMTCNRLGNSTYDEAFLASLIAETAQ